MYLVVVLFPVVKMTNLLLYLTSKHVLDNFREAIARSVATLFADLAGTMPKAGWDTIAL